MHSLAPGLCLLQHVSLYVFISLALSLYISPSIIIYLTSLPSFLNRLCFRCIDLPSSSLRTSQASQRTGSIVLDLCGYNFFVDAT